MPTFLPPRASSTLACLGKHQPLLAAATGVDGQELSVGFDHIVAVAVDVHARRPSPGCVAAFAGTKSVPK